jgi:hypothetical protein
MALAPQAAAALLAVLGRRHTLEAAAADFQSVFVKGTDQLSACRALALLLQVRTCCRRRW